jgi:hypothetical protein
MLPAVSETIPRLSEIVDLIVDERGDPDVRAEVARTIRHSFGSFRHYTPWFARASKAALAKNAKKIADSVTALEAELATASALLVDFLFTPPWARGTAIPAEFLSALRMTYSDDTLERLRRMRLDCERLLADQAKEREQHALRRGPEIDHAQRHCAILAYVLIAGISRKRITGSTDGGYHRVASLLFEALTGRADVDLKRHCDFVRKVPPHFALQQPEYRLPERTRLTCT